MSFPESPERRSAAEGAERFKKVTTVNVAKLRPSSLPKKNQCIWWENTGESSVYSERGNVIDDCVDQFLKGDPQVSVGASALSKGFGLDIVTGAEWVANKARELLLNDEDHPLDVKRKLQLWDIYVIPAELVMEGTCDICGWAKEDEMLELWDTKSGKQRDYKEQLMAYALALMDETSEVECRIRVMFCDKQGMEVYIVTRQECEELVFGIVERVRAGTEPPQENEYCSMCAKQPTCPVWTVPANQALNMTTGDNAPAAYIAEHLEMLKDNPELLGRFIDAWRKAEKLVEKAGLEDFAKELLMKDPKSVPGWRLSKCDGKEITDTAKLKEQWENTREDPIPTYTGKPFMKLLRIKK